MNILKEAFFTLTGYSAMLSLRGDVTVSLYFNNNKNNNYNETS